MCATTLLLRRGALLALLLTSSCQEPYTPRLNTTVSNLLVVNGFINSQGVTVIALSRSLAPNSTQTPPIETRAVVSIRSEQGTTYPLSETAPGTYTSASLHLDPTLRYQLHISTSAVRQYESALSAVKTSPVIDQVHWHYEDAPAAGVRVFVDSHDDTRASTYYRWQYEGTWQFTSRYQAILQYNPSTKLIEYRKDDIYHCWRTEPSTTIVQTNTAGLTKDAVLDYALTFLPVNSEQIRYKYSILVRQFTETQEEYDYWDLLRKNSQSVGSLNDPLPSQLTGNVHCLSDASEPVLGYVGAHSVAEKRIFISSTDVPQVATARPDLGAYTDCKVVVEDRCPGTLPGRPCGSLPPLPVPTDVFNTSYYMIYGSSLDLAGRYFEGSTPECVDCRLRGTNVKPSFWP